MTDSAVVFTARHILTMEPAYPDVPAVAVADGRILSVGTLEQVRAALRDLPYELDETFRDAVLCAGLIDQHAHPLLGATTLVTDVIATEAWELPGRVFPAATSEAEYRSRLAAAVADAQDPTALLMSWGYHAMWHGELDRSVLDGISATTPIVVWQRSCHEFFLNSAAIELLGLTEDAMKGQGRASDMVDFAAGHWWETGTNLLVPALFPAYFTPARIAAGLRQMIAYMHSKGVTAINEPGVLPVEPWPLYQQILGDEDTPLFSTFLVDARTQADAGMTPDEAVADARAQVARAAEGTTPDGKVRLLPDRIKLFADGAIIAQRMQMREPYLDADGRPDPDHVGEWMMDPAVFRAYARAYWDAGWQLNVHVNGDQALDMVLDTLEECLVANPRADHRTVIVHFANSTSEQIDRIARLGAIVSANPYYPVGFADKYSSYGLGPGRADVMVRAGSVVARHIPLSYHSDLPMGPSDPLALASFGVNRVTPSGRVAGPDERISVAAALRAVTIEAAYSWQLEDDLGSIAPGKWANFTVLAENPFEVDPLRLHEIPVLGTVFQGRWFPVADGQRPASGAG